MNELAIIKLKFVPYYAMFRYDRTWWYHIPPADSPENAIQANPVSKYHAKLERISTDNVVAAYSFELPKTHIQYGKKILLNEQKDK